MPITRRLTTQYMAAPDSMPNDISEIQQECESIARTINRAFDEELEITPDGDCFHYELRGQLPADAGSVRVTFVKALRAMANEVEGAA